jgi:cyclopropane fatty-acyl-phospholipid synthase-like methyltransferase
MAFGSDPEPELLRFIRSNGHKGKALDLGCGDGRHSLFLAKAGYHVTGVDVSRVGLKKLEAISSFEKLSSAIALHHSDARDFNYPAENYDFIAAVTLFDHIPKPDVFPLFEKVAGSLKIGGTIFVKVHTINDPGHTNGKSRASELAWAINHYFEPKELKNLFKEKFKILKYSEYDDLDKTHGQPHFHNFAIALARRVK